MNNKILYGLIIAALLVLVVFFALMRAPVPAPEDVGQALPDVPVATSSAPVIVSPAVVKPVPARPIVDAPTGATSSQLFMLTNAVRAVPLTYSSVLERLAQQRANYLCTHDFSHEGYRQFLDKAGYHYEGENLAKDFSNTADMFVAFMASPTHKANIVKAQYTHIGIAWACSITVVFFGGTPNL